MKVYAKDLKVGQLIKGEIVTCCSEPFYSNRGAKKDQTILEILKITETTESFGNGRFTELKAYILTFKEGDFLVNNRQKFELI
jgi:hypothetical protein